MNIRSFIIPVGKLGYLDILPNIPIWVLDHFNWVWRREIPYCNNMLCVPQFRLTNDKFFIKDYIQNLFNEKDHYAILLRSNNCFGIACAEKEFIAPHQRFVR